MRKPNPRGCCGNPGIRLKCAQGQNSSKGSPRATYSTDRAQTSGNVSPMVELCPPHATFRKKVRARRDVSEEKKSQLYTYTYDSRRYSCLRQKHIKSEIGSQPTSTYIATTTITTHTHVIFKSIGKENTNKSKEEKGKERKKKSKRKRKGNKEKYKKSKERQDNKKRKQGRGKEQKRHTYY